MREAHPSRRAVLVSAGALAVSGCLGPTDEPTPRPDPDLRLRDRVAAEVDELVRSYAAATAAFPALADRLTPLAAEHQAHAAALRGPRSGSSPTAAPSGSPGATSPAPAVPGSAGATVTWLAGLERRAARRRARQAGSAGRDLARLLASVGACESVHAVLLGGSA
jgi:hypothetical protein